MSSWQIAAFVWAVSASIALEAVGEALDKQVKKRWAPVLILSLTPVVNTIVAAIYARQKLKGLRG